MPPEPSIFDCTGHASEERVHLYLLLSLSYLSAGAITSQLTTGLAMESSSRSDEKGPTKPDSTASLPSQSAASEGGSSLPPLPTRSAASEVLLVPELRQRILRHLNRKSLACFMRVDRKFMFDVATELYHTMDYGWVRSHMAMTTVRTLHQLLCQLPVNGERIMLIPRSVNGLTAWPYG